MNSRHFQGPLADWAKSRRNKSKVITQQDAALRAAYREIAARDPKIDVWPRVFTYIQSVPMRPRQARASRHWAWGAVVATIVVGTCGLLHLPGTTRPGHTNLPVVTPGADPSGAGMSASGDAFATLADVPQVNPAVDDPARLSVEQIWVQLGSRPASETQSQ